MHRRAVLACCLHDINGVVAGNNTLLLLLRLLLLGLGLVRRVCGAVLLGAVGCVAWRCALLWLAAWGLARRTALLFTLCCCCSPCHTL